MSILKRKTKAARQPAKPQLKPEPLNIAALTKLQLVMILAAAGSRITESDIDRDLTEGCPVNADGSFHLVNYAAWLASLAD